MKKLFLIFLLLSSVIFSGCGATTEDENPQVLWTTPSKGDVDFPGKDVLVSFDKEMAFDSMNLSSVYVIDDITRAVWPVVLYSGTTCTIEITAVEPGVGLEDKINRTFLFKLDDTCALAPGRDMTLVISQNVRSKTGQTLDAPYRASFTTGI